MYPYNLMYVVTHGGDMWTASCNAWKAVRALARWLIVTKHRKLLKAIKISSENHAAALLRTAFLLSSCPTQCGYDPAAPQCFLAPQMSHHKLTAAGLRGGWGLLIVKVTVQDQGSTRWQISPASAVQENRKKKDIFLWNSWSSGDLLNQCYTVHAACSVCCC